MLLLFVLFLCCPSSSLHGVAADPGPDPRATPTSDAIPTPAPTRRPIVTPAPIRPAPPPGRSPDPFVAADADLAALRLSVGRVQAQRDALWQAPATHSRPPRVIKRVQGDYGVQDGSEPDPRPDWWPNWWDVGIDLPADLLCSVQIHVYDGPSGDGWVLVADIDVDGEIYRRWINIGPETYRDTDWEVYPGD